MRAALATSINPDDPLAGLTVGDTDEPDLTRTEGGTAWVKVQVRASALNHHDLWSLRGVGLPVERLPMILGCDAAGVDDGGRDVLIYSVIADPADPRGYSLLSEHYPGTIAEWVAVPRANLIDKPVGVSFTDAACLPTAYLTAYRMLTGRGRIDRAQSILVQGAGGGVSTAAVVLATALGKRVYATSRDPAKRERVAELGAIAVEPGARLPERVDLVLETVGAATFDHSLKCLAPGGAIVVSGATSGNLATVDLRRVFALQLEILGSSMGTRDELAALLELCAGGLRPVVDSVYGFSEVRQAFERLNSGAVFGKVVLDHTR